MGMATIKRRLIAALCVLVITVSLSTVSFSSAEAAPLAAYFLTPASGTFLVGSTFDVSVVLDTKGTAVNTVEVELSFPPDRMQLASPSVGKSIIQVWPAPPAFSNSDGKIYFVGGIPSPGIVTSDGILLTLTFRVVAPGEAELRFGEKVSVLANDGQATNVLGQRPSAFYRFRIPPPQGPVISSPTHPDQERWYKNPNPIFVWPKGQFSSGYSFAIDRDPQGVPDTVAETAEATASFSDLENGIWYFHLLERAGEVWGGVSHYVVKIDRQPPASFSLHISPSRRTANRSPIFRFFSTDALSGLSHFEMKSISLKARQGTEALFFEVTSPYQATNLPVGRYQVIVRALDRAGNARDETVTLSILGPWSRFLNAEGIDLIFVFITWRAILVAVAIIALIFLVILTILWLRHRHHIRHAFREDILRFLQIFRRSKRKVRVPHEPRPV